MRKTIENWRAKARTLKRKVQAIHLAYRDPRVPWYAKLLAIVVLGYLFSPIDLIPDFIPVLGLLDDLILVPFGLWLLLKLIPPLVLAEYEAQVDAAIQKPQNWAAAIVILLLWILGMVIIGMVLLRGLNR